MNNKIKITKEEAFDLMDADDTMKVEEWATKHDCHAVLYVFKKDDKYYEMMLEFSYSDGCQSFEYNTTIDAIEVRPVEKTIISWVKVENDNKKDDTLFIKK